MCSTAQLMHSGCGSSSSYLYSYMLYVYFLRCNMQYNPPYLSESDIQCECEIRIIVDHSLDIQTLFSGHPSVIRLMVIITACYHRVKGGLGAAGGGESNMLMAAKTTSPPSADTTTRPARRGLQWFWPGA